MAKQKCWDGSKWVQVAPSMEEFDEHKADYTSHTGYADDTGTANAKVIVLNPAPIVYKKGMSISFLNLVTNTGAATINANAMGIKSLTNSKGSPLIAGSLKAGLIYSFRFNGTSFNQQGEGGEYGNVTAPDVLAGRTFGTESGLVTGTLKKGAVIKSVQHGSAGIRDKPLVIDITGVDLTKSYIDIHTAGNNSVGSGSFGNILASFISTSQISLERIGYNPNANFQTNITWEVVEFAEGVKVQSGTVVVEFNEYAKNVFITPVVLSRATILFSSQGSTEYGGFIRPFFLGGGTIGFERSTASYPVYGTWFVVEYL